MGGLVVRVGFVDLSLILGAILPVYLLGLAGYLLRYFGVLNEEMEGGMLKMVIHFLYPCLILDKVLGNEVVRDGWVLGWGIGLGLGLVCLGMLVAFGVGALLGLKPGTGRRTFTLAAGVQNYGYIAIPMLGALFVLGGDDEVFGVLFVHSLGVEIGLWVVGVIVLTGSVAGNLKYLVNGPSLAVVFGVALSLTDGWRFLDVSGGGVLGGSVRQAMSWLGACAFPVGLMLIGATMFSLIGKEKVSARIATGALIVRVIVMPFVFLAAAKWLPLVVELKQVLVVQASMPAAVTPILIARYHRGSPGVAVQAVIVTSLVALVTIPLWISIGIWFIFG